MQHESSVLKFMFIKQSTGISEIPVLDQEALLNIFLVNILIIVTIVQQLHLNDYNNIQIKDIHLKYCKISL